MQTSASMKKMNSCLLFFLSSILFFSCSSNQPDFSKMTWISSGNDDGISYSILKTTPGEKGQPGIKYTGLLNGDKFEPDSLSNLSRIIADTSFISAISNEAFLKRLSKGSEGYIKLDIEDYFQNAASTASHYIFFYPPYTSISDLKNDSIKLLALNLFKKINIVTQDEAADEFSKNSPDIEWRKFLDSNPLPQSIDLTLKKEIFRAGKLDSVKDVLTKLFPDGDLSSTFANKNDYLKPATKKSIIYSFTVL